MTSLAARRGSNETRAPRQAPGVFPDIIETAVWTSFQAYIGQNPNAFQIVSTFVIGVAAFLIWKFVFNAPSS